MKKVITISLFCIAAMLLNGCEEEQKNRHRNFEQPLGSDLTTSIGGTIFRLNKTGDLPNVFGGRSIWGGKIDKGFAEMKLTGIEGTVLTLEILEINKYSSETTMDRYKPFLQNQNSAVSVDVDNTVIIGNQEQPKPYVVKFDTSKQRNIVISGVRITFTEVQPYSVLYRLDDIQP